MSFGSFKSSIAFRIEHQNITISKMLAFQPSKNLQMIQICLFYKGKSTLSKIVTKLIFLKEKFLGHLVTKNIVDHYL